jgi:hypothetical protein
MNGYLPADHDLAAASSQATGSRLSPTVAKVASIGALVIESLTVVCAGYLLAVLLRRGYNKLRVKMLLGMVISDVLLGLVGRRDHWVWLVADLFAYCRLVGLVTNIAYTAGYPFHTGSGACVRGGTRRGSSVWLTAALAVPPLGRLRVPPHHRSLHSTSMDACDCDLDVSSPGEHSDCTDDHRHIRLMILSPPALPAFSCDEVHGKVLAHLVGGDLGGSLLTFRQ